MFGNVKDTWYTGIHIYVFHTWYTSKYMPGMHVVCIYDNAFKDFRDMQTPNCVVP